ncbi:MAG: nucleoside kinase [Kiritimatiellae bacterium]|nr:nucleoside kinase [Kiritimatiellia bacterium]
MNPPPTVKISVRRGGRTVTETVPAGTRMGELLPSAAPDGLPHVAALFNNEVVSLRAPAAFNGTLVGLTARDGDGRRVFRRTACMLLAMAAGRALPALRLRVRHSLSGGMFFTLREGDRGAERPVSAAEARALSRELAAIVAADLPIDEIPCGYEEALGLFAAAGQHDKVGLLRHRNDPVVLLQACAEFRELHQGPALPRTGLLSPAEIVRHEGGAVLRLPPAADPRGLAPFAAQPGLMRIHREHARWGELLGVRCAAELNEAIAEGRIRDVMQMSEALHDKTFARLAERIAGRRPRPRLVLIAGPSAAGKTTSCKRLAIHLQVLGLRPVTLSTDDYFVPEDQDPVGPDGKPDFEHIRAVDVPALRRDLKALLAGLEIRRRTFDFKAKAPSWPGDSLRLGPADVLLLEGIHALNPVLTRGIPDAEKFRIFLSAVTQLGIDDTNVLSTTDNRLLRRIVRDHQFRGRSAKDTIAMWAGVRRGEERWIFPFQDAADAAFNSALDYELPVLWPFAFVLLSEIKPSDPEYATARRLMRLLLNFHPIPSQSVPGDSILREYIGGSLLSY